MSAHHCQNSIVHCIDFRFQEALDDFIKTHKLQGACDRIGIAGGVKNIGETFHEIDLSETLHHVQHVYLINHQDCGAYGPEVSADPVKELEKHTKDLYIAKQIINQKYPEVQVHCYFLTLDMEFKEV